MLNTVQNNFVKQKYELLTKIMILCNFAIQTGKNISVGFYNILVK